MIELSPNNKWLKSSIPILLSLIGLVLCVALLKHDISYLISGIILISGIGVLNILRIYNRTENISYDSKFLYLINKTETRKIELNHIRLVKLTMSNQKILGFQIYKYRIEFDKGTNMFDSVTFLTGLENSKIQDFEKHLKYYSQKTKIEHSSNT